MAYAIDTAQAISDLEAAGVEPAAARAIGRTVAASDDEQATKSDLQAAVTTLRAEITAVKSDLTMRIVAAQVATATLLFAAQRFFA